MYKIYVASGTAAMAPQAVLEEIGVAYEAIPIDIGAKQHLADEYRRLNPNGRVPTLVDGDFAMFEAAAISLWLAERHSAAGLMPAPGTHERARTLQWLTHLTNTVQEAFIEFYHPDWYVEGGEAETAFKISAEQRLGELWSRLDAGLAANGPYLSGASFSVADIYLHMLNRWSRNCNRPAWTWPNIRRNVDLVRARPAVQRMMAKQGIAEPC